MISIGFSTWTRVYIERNFFIVHSISLPLVDTQRLKMILTCKKTRNENLTPTIFSSKFFLIHSWEAWEQIEKLLEL